MRKRSGLFHLIIASPCHFVILLPPLHSQPRTGIERNFTPQRLATGGSEEFARLLVPPAGKAKHDKRVRSRAPRPGPVCGLGPCSVGAAVVGACCACSASLVAIILTKKIGPQGTHAQNPFGY